MEKVLVLFGAGQIGHIAYENLKKDVYDGIYFCDNNKDKWGNKDVCEIIGIEELSRLCKDANVEILITTGGWESWRNIIIQCSIKNLGKNIIGVYDEFMHKIVPYQYKCQNVVYSMDNFENFMMEYFGEKEGFYVDIGAFDPYLYSNTVWAANHGWKGMNIEPNPEVIAMFQMYRNNAINLNVGVATETGILKYYMNQESAMNTFSEEYANKVHKHERKIKEIQVRPLKDIFEEYNIRDIDYMDVDVEGKDFDVLLSNDWSKYRPQIVMCEQVSDTYSWLDVEEITQSEIYRFMKDNKYRLINKYGRNAMYEKLK